MREAKKIWALSTKYKKSVMEEMYYSKDDKKITIMQGYRWCKFICISEIKPDIVLDDEQGEYNIFNDRRYDWEMEYCDDGWYSDIVYSDNISEEERNGIQLAWDYNYFEGLEDLGYDHDDTDIILEGPLVLTEEGEA